MACGSRPRPLVATAHPEGLRSGGRVVEGARLESVYRSKAYRGFESHPLRHYSIFKQPYFHVSPTSGLHWRRNRWLSSS